VPYIVGGLDRVKRNSLHYAFPVVKSRESFLSAPSVFLTNFKAKCFEIERRSSGVSELSRQYVEVRRYGACDDDIIRCGRRLVWRNSDPEIFPKLFIKY